MEEIASALLTLAIVLVVAKALEEVFTRIKYPSVLGDILAGFILGPTVLGILTESHYFDILAEIGILAVLFIAGLETNYGNFVRSLRGASITSMIEVSFAFISGTLIGVFLLHYPFYKAFFVGTVLTATSISVTVKTLLDIGKLATPEGNLVLSVAVLDDVLGLLVLSIAVQLVSGELNVFSLALNTSIAIATWILVLYAFHRLSNVITMVMVKTKMEGSRVAIAFALLLFVSYLTANVKLAPIVGAYALGVALSESPLARAIEDRIRVISELFGAFFFTYSIGKVDFKSVLYPQYTPLYVAMLAAAIIGKLLGGSIGAIAIGIKPRRALRVGVGLIPRAEVCIISAIVGYNYGVLPLEVYFSAILIVYVTSIITPVLLKYIYEVTE